MCAKFLGFNLRLSQHVCWQSNSCPCTIPPSLSRVRTQRPRRLQTQMSLCCSWWLSVSWSCSCCRRSFRERTWPLLRRRWRRRRWVEAPQHSRSFAVGWNPGRAFRWDIENLFDCCNVNWYRRVVHSFNDRCVGNTQAGNYTNHIAHTVLTENDG